MSTVNQVILSPEELTSLPAGCVVQDASGERWFKVLVHPTSEEASLLASLTGEEFDIFVADKEESAPEGWDWVCIHGEHHSPWLIIEDASHPLQLVSQP